MADTYVCCPVNIRDFLRPLLVFNNIYLTSSTFRINTNLEGICNKVYFCKIWYFQFSPIWSSQETAACCLEKEKPLRLFKANSEKLILANTTIGKSYYWPHQHKKCIINNFVGLPSQIPTLELPYGGQFWGWAILSTSVIRIAHLNYKVLLCNVCAVYCFHVSANQLDCVSQIFRPTSKQRKTTAMISQVIYSLQWAKSEHSVRLRKGHLGKLWRWGQANPRFRQPSMRHMWPYTGLGYRYLSSGDCLILKIIIFDTIQQLQTIY